MGHDHTPSINLLDQTKIVVEDAPRGQTVFDGCRVPKYTVAIHASKRSIMCITDLPLKSLLIPTHHNGQSSHFRPERDAGKPLFKKQESSMAGERPMIVSCR